MDGGHLHHDKRCLEQEVQRKPQQDFVDLISSF